MNKIFSFLLAALLAVAFSSPTIAHAQAAAPVKQTEQYCLVMATAKLFSTKVIITVDYGQETKFFGDKGVIKDESGKLQSFNSVVDAMNYMNSQGWEFVNAYVVTVSNQNVYHYLMRRRV